MRERKKWLMAGQENITPEPSENSPIGSNEEFSDSSITQQASVHGGSRDSAVKTQLDRDCSGIKEERVENWSAVTSIAAIINQLH